MKKILIAGRTSYIGNEFKKWVEKQLSTQLNVDVVGMKDEEWRKVNFEYYDTVLYVAGIAHENEKKIGKDKYYSVNCDLTYEVAKKAKTMGVKHFVFLSSMSVYGLSTGEINLNTLPYPKSYYGKSKLKAEQLIKKLETENFLISIIRPPLVYGSDCKGNYKKLSKIASSFWFFPKIKNHRSMIYIDNLSAYLAQIIINEISGLHCPQNTEYVCTSNLVKKIANEKRRKIILVKLPCQFVNLFLKLKGPFQKAFGDLTYSKNLNSIPYNYNIVTFEDSITKTEQNNK